MITIGIPVYNQEEYLADAIESALDQKCPVIVCNDGSTDNSLEIARRYPVKVINQVNKGLASARNTLIMNTATEYFLPLDADDLLLENCVERMAQKIFETKADIVAPSFKAFGVQNAEVILDEGLVYKSFAGNNRIPYASAIRKERLLEVGGYSPRMEKGYEDWHLWCDLMKRGATIAVIQEVLFLYRTKEVSMITNAQKYDPELRAQIKKDHPELYE